MKINLKKSLKKVLHYLKSNSYMYSPLLSSSSQSPCNPNFTITGLKENKKKLMNKVGDYLQSDTYMYAPLITNTRVPQTSSSSISSSTYTAGARNIKEVGAATQKVKITEATDVKQTQNQRASANSSPRSTVVRHTLSYRETVKHVIPQNCRSSLVSGGSVEEPRKIVGVKHIL